MFVFITNPSYAAHVELHIAGVSDKLTDFTVGNITALLCIPTHILKSATSAEHQTLKQLYSEPISTELLDVLDLPRTLFSQSWSILFR